MQTAMVFLLGVLAPLMAANQSALMTSNRSEPAELGDDTKSYSIPLSVESTARAEQSAPSESATTPTAMDGRPAPNRELQSRTQTGEPNAREISLVARLMRS